MTLRSLLFSIIFLALGSVVYGQNCSTWKKAHCDKYMAKYCQGSAALVAAASDASIISIKDEVTGKTSYVKKLECTATGSVTYQNVVFSKEKGGFICDLSKCDLSKCDLSKCDISKCMKTTSQAKHASITINKKKLPQVRT